MSNPIIETDIAVILRELQSGQKEILREVVDIKVNLETVKGDIKALDERLSGEIKSLDEKLSGQIKALDTKTEQLNIRVGNVEFASRGILIGIAVVVLGGVGMFFWMASKL